MFEQGIYRSDDETPELDECLQRARADIEIAYNIRAKRANPLCSFVDEWNLLCGDIIGGNDTASRLDRIADDMRLHGVLPEVHILIRVPIVLWLEAKHAFDCGDKERSWAALARCNYYIGMCYSHETHNERSSRGGKNSSRYSPYLRSMVLERLREMADKSRATKQDIWEEIVPHMASFRAPISEELNTASATAKKNAEPVDNASNSNGSAGKSVYGRSQNPRQQLSRWTNGDEEIRAEFVRVAVADLNTRAKRSPKSKAPTGGEPQSKLKA
ncbi:hypothetical protein [Stenotrophomonas maltophilia]|uniref:hypothetical protein n=1 Tax=Stenotrophomonas maltophilia TaxID=40324 RepID=UPI0039C3AC64